MKTELNRYENVERVIRILDQRIIKLMMDDKMNIKDLESLIDVRVIYVKELDGLTRGNNTGEMFKKENGYGR